MMNQMFFIFCLMIGCNQTSTDMIIQDNSLLFKHWVHSYEDDDKEKNYKAYRPNEYDFPPARGRSAFQIKEDGVYLAKPIAPGDGNMNIEQRWELKDDILIVTGSNQIRKFQIISLTKEKLVLKTISDQ